MRHALCGLLTEAEVYRVAFEKEKELTDRALKLAEVGKPNSNWELQEISDFKLHRPRQGEGNETK